MSHGQTPTLGVQLVHIDISHLLSVELLVCKLLRVHGCKVGQNLPCKGFVNLKYTNVRFEVQVVPCQYFLGAIRRAQK